MARLLVFGSSLCVALAIGEIGVRMISPGATFGVSDRGRRLGGSEPGLETFFTSDAEMGFRPVLGQAYYDEFGTWRNEYLAEDRKGRRRLLFMGDSVTARGRIIAELRQRWGDAGFEYWNAGVESFSTAQEVAYYKRFNTGLDPDHVILTFHPNDFETTPAVIRKDDGRLVFFTLHQPATRVNRWLFAHSQLYRAILGVWSRPPDDRSAIEAEVAANLAWLAKDLDRKGVGFTVLVLPYIDDPKNWPPDQNHRRATILAILERLSVRHVDLLPALEKTLAAGRPIGEHPGDRWHPSQEAASAFAEAIDRAGAIAPGPPSDPAAKSG